MIRYKINLTKRAKKQLDKMSDSIAFPILTAIENLAENRMPLGYKKLKGRNFYNFFLFEYIE